MASPAFEPPFEAFFALVPAGGSRLCIHSPPRAALRGSVLHVHAFAEEMNKSRRMSALAVRALADAGYAVLQIDLLGCGDSSGDFADATWAAWLSDLQWAAAWLRQHHEAPLWLWGHRAGALLAAELAPSLPAPCHLLLWNPVLKGKAVMQQFVRLKTAAEWASGKGKAAGVWVKAELAAGRSVEIAGYALQPDLARALDSRTLVPGMGDAGRLVWLEVAGREGEATLSPAAQAQLECWQAAGWQVQSRAVVGPAFWQTVEIEDAPALVTATVEVLESSPVAAAQP